MWQCLAILSLQKQSNFYAHALLNCCHLLANIDISPTSINIKLGERKEIQKTELKQKCEVPALSTGLWVSEPWTAADSSVRVPNWGWCQISLESASRRGDLNWKLRSLLGWINVPSSVFTLSVHSKIQDVSVCPEVTKNGAETQFSFRLKTVKI